MGTLQLEFIVSQGLEPHHTFLDVGCGCLRAGVHFLKYLDEGKYYGIDAQQWLLDAGLREEVPRYGLSGRTLHLLCGDDFQLENFGVLFDFGIAQSVFTHQTWNTILRCLSNVHNVLKPDGRFYASFFEDPDGTHVTTPISHSPGGITTFPDRDPFHYIFETFVALGKRTNLDVTYIGDWNHPRAQKMLCFTPTPRARRA
jgi:SAM-dependent methyltransferase